MIEWIKCSDKLPDKEGKIVIIIGNVEFMCRVIKYREIFYLNSVDELIYFISHGSGKSGWHIPLHFKEPSHWYPLPDKPGEKS